MERFKQKIINLPSIHNTDTSGGRYYTSPIGTRYWSVTTVLGRMADKSGLDEWRKRVGEEEAKKIMTQAGIRGSDVHNIAEKYVTNDPNYLKGTMPFNRTSFRVLKKALDENLQCVYAVEAGLYSDKLKIAGRVDLIGIWNDKLSIIDFKTSRKIKKREWITNYFLQESLYAYMVCERLLPPEQIDQYKKMKLITLMTVDHEDEPFIFEEDASEWFPKAEEIVKRHNEQFQEP